MNEQAKIWLAGFVLVFGGLGAILLFYHMMKQVRKMNGEPIDFPDKDL